MKKLRLGFLHKLVLSYSILLIAFMGVLINVAYNYLLDVSEKNAAINQDQLMEKTRSQMDFYLAELNQMAQQVSGDIRVINLLSRLQQDKDSGNYFDMDIMESIDVGSILTSHNGPSNSVWRISLYNQYGDFICSGASVNPLSRVEENMQPQAVELFMDDLVKRENRFIVFAPENDRWSNTYISRYTSLARPVTNYYATEVYGVVEVQQDIENLESLIALDVRTDITVFVFDSEGKQILPLEVSFADIDQNKSFITQAASEEYGWSVALVQSREQLTSAYRSIIWYLYLGGLVMVAFLLAAVYFIARQLSKPIMSLSQEVRNINIGNIPTNLAARREGTDEVKELGAAFTAMLKKLNDSIAFEKKSYLLALQSQMDPHFLFNSLSIISGMGIEAGSDKIVNACDKLSSMLRYSASYDVQGTTLQDEIDHVQNYLELMKMRFEEHFSYSVQIDGALRSMPMPRLILQPIVENCFEHGFKSIPPPWHVSICVYKGEGDGWQIDIADNGSGFAPEKLREMERKIEAYSKDLPKNYHEMKLGGLGLVNTIIRLKLATNGEISYSIQHNLPVGTIVTLKGDRDDPSSDRRG